MSKMAKKTKVSVKFFCYFDGIYMHLIYFLIVGAK